MKIFRRLKFWTKRKKALPLTYYEKELLKHVKNCWPVFKNASLSGIRPLPKNDGRRIRFRPWPKTGISG